jgi:site-specific recombinase XerD
MTTRRNSTVGSTGARPSSSALTRAHWSVDQAEGARSSGERRASPDAQLPLQPRQANRTVEQLANEWWRRHAAPNLAEWTRRGYRPLLTKHIQPRLGFYRLREITPEVVADFRADLEAAGVGRHAVRVSMVILQSMFKHAIRWRWVPGPNPVQQVEKPSGRRERAVVCLAPAQVEAIRAWLLDEKKLYAATMVSLIAYAGLRTPEELLALEVRVVAAV